jgi:hypothetical protein
MQGLIHLHAERIIEPVSSLRIIPAPPTSSLKDPSTVSLTEPALGFNQGFAGSSWWTTGKVWSDAIIRNYRVSTRVSHVLLVDHRGSME